MRKIAREIARSELCVRHYIHSLNSRPKNQRKRRLKFIIKPKYVTDKFQSSSQLMRFVVLNVSRATACRAMQRLKMRYIKKKARPFWKPHHLQSRLNFAREHMSWNKEWHKVVFQMKSALILMGQMDSSTIGTN